VSGISAGLSRVRSLTTTRNAEATAIGEAVGHKVERPALVWVDRQLERCPCPQCPLAPATPAHLQLLLPVEPAEALLVHAMAIAGQQQMQATVADATPLTGEFPSAEPNSGVAGAPLVQS